MRWVWEKHFKPSHYLVSWNISKISMDPTWFWYLNQPWPIGWTNSKNGVQPWGQFVWLVTKKPEINSSGIQWCPGVGIVWSLPMKCWLEKRVFSRNSRGNTWSSMKLTGKKKLYWFFFLWKKGEISIKDPMEVLLGFSIEYVMVLIVWDLLMFSGLHLGELS